MNKRDCTRLTHVLVELQRQYPEWRFGQLIANVAGWADRDVWDVEDDQLMAAAEEHLKALVNRGQEAHR